MTEAYKAERTISAVFKEQKQISVLTTLGMPEDKAAIYQTRLQAGEFLVMAEVAARSRRRISI